MDWRLMIGQTVKIKSAGRHGTIVARAGNWDEPGNRDCFVVVVPGRGRRCYHIDDLELTIKHVCDAASAERR